MSPSDDYDCYDQYYALPNQSPGLEPVIPNYRHVDTPPPFVPEDTPSSTPSPESSKSGVGAERPEGARRKKRPQGRRAPSYADAVLIGSLDPTQPDIARSAFLTPLEALSDSQDEGSEGDPMSENDGQGHEANHVNAKAVAMAKVALAAVTVADENEEDDEEFKMRDAPREHGRQEPLVNGSIKNEFHSHHSEGPATQMSPESRAQSFKTEFDLKPPPLKPQLLTPIDTANSKSSPTRVYVENPISPNLAKFTITSAEGNPEHVLPAMQMSPPRSSAAHSPETLPSLQTALSMESTGNGSATYSHSSHSPSMTRPSPGHASQFGPSPSSYSHPSPGMSPPVIPPNQGFWRNGHREGSISVGSMSTPSEYQSTPSSLTAITPTSSTSYTPSATTVSEHHHMHNAHHQESNDESNSTTSPGSQGQLLNGPVLPNGPFASSGFKCTYTTCTAVPFQTQYLLNSHMNVHSSSRPHFCPVPDCVRGQGGKGFKRKNEMIRHGLVHDSPGYVCPFCPDQQHKYPRPDNLQRHVRVHHLDKDKDDPQLRQVLAQRPEGGNRGRRRRGGSTG